LKIDHTANITRCCCNILFSFVIENHAIEVDNYLFIYMCTMLNLWCTHRTRSLIHELHLMQLYIPTYILFEASEIQQYRILFHNTLFISHLITLFSLLITVVDCMYYLTVYSLFCIGNTALITPAAYKSTGNRIITVVGKHF